MEDHLMNISTLYVLVYEQAKCLILQHEQTNLLRANWVAHAVERLKNKMYQITFVYLGGALWMMLRCIFLLVWMTEFNLAKACVYSCNMSKTT